MHPSGQKPAVIHFRDACSPHKIILKSSLQSIYQVFSEITAVFKLDNIDIKSSLFVMMMHAICWLFIVLGTFKLFVFLLTLRTRPEERYSHDLQSRKCIFCSIEHYVSLPVKRRYDIKNLQQADDVIKICKPEPVYS